MANDDEKRLAARAAIRFLEKGMIIGVGTGSTVAHFIDALAERKHDIEGAVSSSEQSTRQLNRHGIPVVDFNTIGNLHLYVDGADECDPRKCLIKGGGGALTREKIVAAGAEKFVCIIDSSKRVDSLGKFPLPIEVIPMARNLVARAVIKLGGRPVWREDFVTDNGNSILDVHGLHIDAPRELESELNQLAGVVTVGLFARRPADIVLVGDTELP